MRSSNKKGAEDKYFGLFTPQNDNKYNIKKTVYSFFYHGHQNRQDNQDRQERQGRQVREDRQDRQT